MTSYHGGDRERSSRLQKGRNDDARFYEGRSVEDPEDMNVVGPGGGRIGEIEEILANAGNEIAAVVVEYDDGFLDLGEREVIMPVDRLEFGPVGTEVTTAMSEEELKALDVWDD